MEALKAILTRRSVRRFSDKPVSQENLETILRAAMAAPSATNEQPWHFLVITDRPLICKITEIHQHAAMCYQASAAIIPCINLAEKEYRDFWVEDMSAATQNILLAVRALDMAAVWVGIYPNEGRVNEFRKLFKLPPSVIPFALIPIGHSDVVQKEELDRFKKERIHWHKWE
jgi:nitroreductase